MRFTGYIQSEIWEGMKSSKDTLESIQYYFFEERDSNLLKALSDSKNSLRSFRLFTSASLERKPYYTLIAYLLSDDLNTSLIKDLYLEDRLNNFQDISYADLDTFTNFFSQFKNLTRLQFASPVSLAYHLFHSWSIQELLETFPKLQRINISTYGRKDLKEYISVCKERRVMLRVDGRRIIKEFD